MPTISFDVRDATTHTSGWQPQSKARAERIDRDRARVAALDSRTISDQVHATRLAWSSVLTAETRSRHKAVPVRLAHLFWAASGTRRLSSPNLLLARLTVSALAGAEHLGYLSTTVGEIPPFVDSAGAVSLQALSGITSISAGGQREAIRKALVSLAQHRETGRLDEGGNPVVHRGFLRLVRRKRTPDAQRSARERLRTTGHRAAITGIVPMHERGSGLPWNATDIADDRVLWIPVDFLTQGWIAVLDADEMFAYLRLLAATDPFRPNNGVRIQDQVSSMSWGSNVRRRAGKYGLNSDRYRALGILCGYGLVEQRDAATLPYPYPAAARARRLAPDKIEHGQAASWAPLLNGLRREALTVVAEDLARDTRGGVAVAYRVRQATPATSPTTPAATAAVSP